MTAVPPVPGTACSQPRREAGLTRRSRRLPRKSNPHSFWTSSSSALTVDYALDAGLTVSSSGRTGVYGLAMVRKSRTTFEDPAERVAFLEKSEGSQSPPLSSLPRFGPPSTSTISISPALGSGPLGTDAGKSAPRAWRRLVGASLFGITVFGAGLYASRDFGRSWQAVQEAADKLDFLQSLRPTQAVDLGAAVVDDDDALIAGLSSGASRVHLVATLADLLSKQW